MSASRDPCFHCGDPLPRGRIYEVTIDGVQQRVCCPGCQAVANLIAGSGFKEFYRYRDTLSQRPRDEDIEPSHWAVYDREELQKGFVDKSDAGAHEAALLIEGVRCAACSWLIERSLEREPGVLTMEVNPATARARLRWDPEKTPLSRILGLMGRLGYRPHPASPDEVEQAAQRERRQALKRLFVAGFGMMQVMMYAVALYAGAFQEMDPVVEQFLRLVSLLVATPVAFYAGWPFFAGAIRDLRARSPGMDVPVSLAIGGAYLASVWNSFVGHGEVYFDSVSMFVFFLSLGRYLEMAARHRAGSTADALARLAPATALRIGEDGTEQIGVNEIEVGDLLLVRPGDRVPTDGRITDGETSIDESLLTGESRPVRRGTGDEVTGGSTNLTAPIRMRVERVGADTVLAGISRLLHGAQSTRPRLARAADRVASYFVSGVLLAAVLVAWYWWRQAPDEAFRITLAVLVVTCPCALSLATPATLTAATGFLARHGLLVTRSEAVETLARVSHMVFDKTGTLTVGTVSIEEIRCGQGEDEQHCLDIAAALELHSAHPIAAAFTGPRPDRDAEDVGAHPGAGIEGSIAGRYYRLGAPAFVDELSSDDAGVRLAMPDDEASWVMLGDASGRLAAFRLGDPDKPEAVPVMEALAGLGIVVEIASGDRERTVAAIAQRLGVDRHQGRLSPDEKLALIRTHQQRGDITAMVGDGINDAPVLAGADVSVALHTGAPLAQTSADMVLLGNSLKPLVTAVTTTRKAMTVVRQNLGWAVLYNLVALPLAAAGWVQPWMAAVGMSASSLLVVLNALRVGRSPGRSAPIPEPLAAGAAPQGIAR